jgi:peptide/nickel transport system substrate-binding protein
MSNDHNVNLLRALHAKKLNRRSMMAAAAMVPAAGLLAGSGVLVSPAGSARAQMDPRTLVILDNIQGGNWLYFDPGRFYEINPSAGLQVTYETLYHIPDGYKPGEIVPLLAEDLPTISEDGLTATIKIKQGVKFHNSDNEMTAADWVWSWDRLKNLKGNASFLITDFMTDYKAVDDYTLEITMPSPNAALVAVLASLMLAVMDSKAGEEHGGVATETADADDTLTDWLNEGNSIGTGPYILTGWDISSEVTIEANPNYWGEPAGFDRIIFRNVADTSTQLQLLETGEADIAFAVDPDKMQQVLDNPGLQLLEGPSLAFEYVAMHTSEDVGGPLAKKEARQAIAHAIDYQGIIDGLMGGRAIRPATVIPLGLLGADTVQPNAYQTDLAKANELWAASGNGPTELTLTYGAGQTAPGGLNRDVLAAKLQADIQGIEGVTVTLLPMDPTQRLADFRAGKLQFTMSDWSPDYVDVHTYADPFGREGGAAARRVAYANPKVDELLDKGIGEADVEAREAIYVEIQETLQDDAAFIVEFQPNYVMPAAASVKGVMPHGVYILQLRNATREESA